MLDGIEGGMTKHFPSGEVLPIYDAAMKYKDEGVPLVVFAGKEYGTGSSRDWAAKGTILLGVRAVIAESFERIHRSNLVGMGVAPFSLRRGRHVLGDAGPEGRRTGLDRRPHRDEAARRDGGQHQVGRRHPEGREDLLRIDTAEEMEYYRNGGILQYVLRRLAA